MNILLEKGTNVNLSDGNGLSALDVAVRDGSRAKTLDEKAEIRSMSGEYPNLLEVVTLPCKSTWTLAQIKISSKIFPPKCTKHDFNSYRVYRSRSNGDYSVF